MNIIDLLIIIQLLIAFPVGVYIFAGKKMNWEDFKDMCDKYRYHFFILFGVYILKSVVHLFEVAFSNRALNLTPMIHEFEGNSVFWVQYYLQNEPLTYFMAVVYIGSYLFIMTFSLAIFCYTGRKRAASKIAFLYIVMLLLTAPFFVFVQVFVPSYPKMFYPGAESIITGIEPLLYNLGPNVNEFFVNYDTFDNCFPSMHIGYPTAILLTILVNVRNLRGYKWFLFAMLMLIGFSIIYLGIHWLTDIVAGVLFAMLGVIITERYARGFWRRVHSLDVRLRRRFKWW